MKILSRHAHGFIDYAMGLILILAPIMFGFEGAARTVPLVLGVATLIYSLCTNYELGLLKLVPFRAHLTLDAMSGVLLALSPWLFGFSDRVWMPHLILGLAEIGTVLMTRTAASAEHHSPVRHS